MTETEELRAIEQIKALKARYWRAVDTKDAALLRDVFTADARADYRGSEADGDADAMLMIGADQIVERTIGGLVGVVTAHHGHNPEIAVTSPATATGIWAMQDWLWVEEGAPLPFRILRGWGHYHETYRKTAIGWRIQTTKLVRSRIETE